MVLNDGESIGRLCSKKKCHESLWAWQEGVDAFSWVVVLGGRLGGGEGRVGGEMKVVKVVG